MNVVKEILEIYIRMQKTVDVIAQLKEAIDMKGERISMLTERVERLEKIQAQDNGCVSKEIING